jgi:poly(glycerol-phosphate) alpha-glucosyltransferase
VFGRSVLPRGDYYALTWSVPREFGGLTNVFLHRAEVFRSLGKRPIQILTLAPDLDPRATKHRLLANGQVSRRTKVRNLWHELSRADDKTLAALGHSGMDKPQAASRALEAKGEASADLLNDAEKVLQTDRFRANGTRYASDQKDAKKPGTLGGRLVTLYSSSGQPVASFASMARLQSAWLDHVIGAKEAFLINDSQFLADYVAGYRRPNVTTVQALHNSHLASIPKSITGELSKSKAKLVRRTDDYDMLAVLTEQQHEDLLATDLGDEDLRMIPNSREIPAAPEPVHRDPADGVMAVRFSYQKHPQAAVRATWLAHQSNPAVHLDLFGKGYEEEKVKAVVDELGAHPAVALKGFDPKASQRFATASFSLLTSRFEGQGLVLLESMAAGCLPIAFDIRYGPRDIITDGVNGFLVPAGDIEAMSKVILKVASMSDADLAPLRAAARARAEEFADDLILPLWGAELTRARDRKRADRLAAAAVTLTAADVTEAGLELAFTVPDSTPKGTWHAGWDLAPLPWFGRVPVEGDPASGASVLLPAARLAELPAGDATLFIDQVVVGDHRRIALPAPKGWVDRDTPWGWLRGVKGKLVLQREAR